MHLLRTAARSAVLALVGLAATSAAPAVATSAPPGQITLQAGAALTGITTAPLALTPAFSPLTTDYVIRCPAAENDITVTLSTAGASVAAPIELAENQALVVDAPGGPFWIRCLPPDFPQFTVAEPGKPPPGWYVTGNLGLNGASYAMVLDQNGTPVWYQRTAGLGAIDVTPLAGGRLAWASNPGPGFGTAANAAFTVFDPATGRTTRLQPPTRPLDFHDLAFAPNGDALLLTTPLRPAVDLRPLAYSANQTIVDCVIDEVSPSGRLVWQWRVSDRVRVAESTHPFPVVVERQTAYDIYHCNSLDVDPATGDVLLSLHNADAVYLIDRRSGAIRWKLGGNAVTAGERHVVVEGDPEGTFHGQHDARLRPGGDVSLYDNHTWYLGAARGVEYHVDPTAGAAPMVWEYASPDDLHSGATGSFRRSADGRDNLVAWGLKASAFFTEVDAAKNVLLSATFPSSDSAYRVVKVPPATFDHDLLRRTAGLDERPFPARPEVLAVAPAGGYTTGGAAVTISGTGLSGATAVRFGTRAAASFTVAGDSSLTAVAPSGSGTVDVTVTTPGGASRPGSGNLLVGSDGSFEAGTGSWLAGTSTTIALANHGRSGRFALQLTPTSGGAHSALTGPYPIPAGARITGSLWVEAPRDRHLVRASLVFTNAAGAPIWQAAGRPSIVSARWVRVAGTATAPPGTAAVALAVDDTGSGNSLYADDAALTGSSRFAYERPPLRVLSVSPDHGSVAGGTTVTIAGSGLADATGVEFGGRKATSFSIAGDASITAVAPSGSGQVAVTVRTPTGVSSTTPTNLLAPTDAGFEQGPGTWTDNVNAAVSPSAGRARTGTGALEVTPLVPGFDSAIGGPYPAAPETEYHTSVWVATAGRAQHVHPFLVFYGPAQQVLSVEQAPTYTRTAGRWTKLSLTALSPAQTVLVSLGVDDADGDAPISLDDATLTGSTRFTYTPAGRG